MHELAHFVVDVPDFPKQGILFRDISKLLREHFPDTVRAIEQLFSAAEWDNFELYFRECFEQIIAYAERKPLRLAAAR